VGRCGITSSAAGLAEVTRTCTSMARKSEPSPI
jgi:hypothetical protein